MLNSLRLRNFRSYRDQTFEFESGINIVVGPNASGKTNLLEAVLVAAQGSSFRARDKDLVRFGAPWARLDAIFDSQQRVIKLTAESEIIKKSFEINGTNLHRLSLERTLPVVLFEPNHLQLISRGPEQRRLFFDDLLARTQVGFKTTGNKYQRALAQRNALLKQPQAKAKGQLFVWDVRLSELGAEIVEARLKLIDQLNNKLGRIYSRISGKRTKLHLVYDSPIKSDSYSSRLLSQLEQNAQRDFARGFTSYGPHREDVTIMLKAKPAALSASRGESRSIILALKIAELDLVEAAREQQPLFLLDDVFSELDGKRRRQLVDYLKGYQTLITTTDADSVLEYFATHNLIPLQVAKW